MPYPFAELGEFECDLEGRFSVIRTQECNLGNFICDIMVAATNADLAILNSGTLRSDCIHPAGKRPTLAVPPVDLHSVSDYKKHLYKKRLVDLVLTKKQTLVYFSDLRNAFCKKLFLLKELRNAHTKIYP